MRISRAHQGVLRDPDEGGRERGKEGGRGREGDGPNRIELEETQRVFWLVLVTFILL